jgi:hypothetical protein
VILNVGEALIEVLLTVIHLDNWRDSSVDLIIVNHALPKPSTGTVQRGLGHRYQYPFQVIKGNVPFVRLFFLGVLDNVQPSALRFHGLMYSKPRKPIPSLGELVSGMRS